VLTGLQGQTGSGGRVTDGWFNAFVYDAPSPAEISRDPVQQFGDFDAYRRALESGSAHLTGKSVLDGIPTYRLETETTAGAVGGPLTVVVDVRASDYLPLSADVTQWTTDAKGARIVDRRYSRRYVAMVKMPAAEAPDGIFELPIPKGVPVIEDRMLSPRQAADLGRVTVYWLGEQWRGTPLEGGGMRLTATPPGPGGWYHSGHMPPDEQVVAAGPRLGTTFVTATYYRAAPRGPQAPLKLRVVSYPHVEPSYWTAPVAGAVSPQPRVDTTSSVSVAGREALLVTKTLQVGTARYLLVDFSDATVVVESLDGDEASILAAGEALQAVR
jgi:hypothetical protein